MKKAAEGGRGATKLFQCSFAARAGQERRAGGAQTSRGGAAPPRAAPCAALLSRYGGEARRAFRDYCVLCVYRMDRTRGGVAGGGFELAHVG